MLMTLDSDGLASLNDNRKQLPPIALEDMVLVCKEEYLRLARLEKRTIDKMHQLINDNGNRDMIKALVFACDREIDLFNLSEEKDNSNV